MTIEIPQNHWPMFCEKLNTMRDALLDIRVQADGDMRLVTQGAQFQSANYYQGDACNSTLVVEFGPGDERPSQHRVIEPIRLILRKASDGDHYNLLEMPAESGTTVVSFRPGISPKLLGDLQNPVAA